MKLLAVAAAMTLSTLVGGADQTSVNIVDAPRPQMKWGYAPATRVVPPGTWVTWSNNGEDAHTVTALDGSFDSGNLDSSEGFSWYFDQPGTYPYVCSWHPWMLGRVVVSGAVPDPGQQ